MTATLLVAALFLFSSGRYGATSRAWPAGGGRGTATLAALLRDQGCIPNTTTGTGTTGGRVLRGIMSFYDEGRACVRVGGKVSESLLMASGTICQL